MVGTVDGPGSRGRHRAGSLVGDSRETASPKRRYGRSRRGAAHGRPVRYPAPDLRRPKPESGLSAFGQRFLGLDPGDIGDSGGKDYFRGRGRLLSGRGGPAEPGPSLDARRLSAGLAGALGRGMDRLDAVVYRAPFWRGTSRDWVRKCLPKPWAASGGCWRIFTDKSGTQPNWGGRWT